MTAGARSIAAAPTGRSTARSGCWRRAQPSSGPATGARRLGRSYWLEVRRASHGLVRCRESDSGVQLLLLSIRPALLTFASAEVTVDSDEIRCSYRIAGGLLARREGGTLSLTQRSGERPELRVEVEGFFPRLGVLYEPLERRFHVSVSRRYLARLINEAQP